VFRASSPELGDLALRVPWTRWISNDNDPALDARELLQKEELLANHMGRQGVPTPSALARHSGADDFDFLVSTFVWSDASTADAREFGRVVRRIHEAPLLHGLFHGMAHAGAGSAAPGPALEEQIAERMLRRGAVAERLGSMRLDLPSRATLEGTLRAGVGRRSILHMDARQANLLTRAGAVVGIVDWSNALIGDPELELARIAEYGALDTAFLEGYEALGSRAVVPRELELTYRLDTALMLAVVFLSEAPDPERGRRQLARVLEILAALRASYTRGVPSSGAPRALQ
jgi:aminoglycoside phosphotransferase (APT) family kinase protein